MTCVALSEYFLMMRRVVEHTADQRLILRSSKRTPKRSGVSHDVGGSRRRLSKDINDSPSVDHHRAIVIGPHRHQGTSLRVGQGSGKYSHDRLESHNALRTTRQLGSSSDTRVSHVHSSLQRQPKSRSPPPAMRRYLAEGKESSTLERVGRNEYLRGDERMSLYVDTWEKLWEEVSNMNSTNCTLEELKVFGSIQLVR